MALLIVALAFWPVFCPALHRRDKPTCQPGDLKILRQRNRAAPLAVASMTRTPQHSLSGPLISNPGASLNHDSSNARDVAWQYYLVDACEEKSEKEGSLADEPGIVDQGT